MKLSELKKIFENDDIETFKESISQEITNYKSKLGKKGSSIPIIVEEDLKLNIGTTEAIFLLDAFVSKQLSEHEIAYIADALLLSEAIKFESEEVLDDFESLTDLSINDSFTLGKAMQKLLLLKSRNN
jgi:hypothetical protein